MIRPTPWFARSSARKDPARRDDAGRRKSAPPEPTIVDALEVRQVLSTILTVTNDVDLPSRTTANASIYDHSLRGVIQQANAQPAGANVSIDFKVDGGGFAEILPVSPLPAITRPVTIDGTSEPLRPNGTATGTRPSSRSTARPPPAGLRPLNGLTSPRGRREHGQGPDVTGFNGTGLRSQRCLERQAHERRGRPDVTNSSAT